MLKKCVFSHSCDARHDLSPECPYNVQNALNTVLLSRIDCPVLQAILESEKERRVRYAAEKRVRDEVQGGRREAGTIEARTRYPRP